MSGFAHATETRRHDALGLIASRENLIVSMHWGRPSLEHVEELADAVAELVAVHKRFATVVLVTGDRILHAPDPETRERLRQLVEDTTETGLGTAFVVTRGGFLGSAAVALLSGLFLLSRSPEPNQAFRTIEAAAPWLQEQLVHGPVDWQPNEVHETLEAIVALRSCGPNSAATE